MDASCFGTAGPALGSDEREKRSVLRRKLTSRRNYYETFFATWEYSATIASVDEARVRDPKGALMVRLPFFPV